MSKKSFVPLQEVVKTIQNTISHDGLSSKAQPVMGMLTVSNESLQPEQRRHLEELRTDFKNSIVQMFNGLGIESLGFQTGDEIDQHVYNNAVAAAAYVAMAAGNPAAFASVALESRFASADNAPLVVPNTYYGSGGQMDYRDMGARPALEAYDNKNLTDFLPYSVAFNIYGQRQDEFSELLYKTFVVPPEQAGVEITASRLLVYRDQNHVSPSYYDMGKKNLINAYVDYTILKDESTRLIPYADPAGANDPVLVPATLVADSYLELGGVSVPTRPLLMGANVNLLGVSQYQPLIGLGILNNQDAVDSAIRLEEIVLSTGVANAPGVILETLRLPGNQWQRALRGNYRDMTLNFRSAGLAINGTTTASDGSAVAMFAAIGANNYTVMLDISVNGYLNTEKGNCVVTASTVTVSTIYDQNNNVISLTSGTGATIVTALAGLTVAGYTLRVNRTNSNRRTRGLRLDTTLVRERYYIPLGAPLSVARPNDPWQQAQATDLKAIVTAARIRNTNNAITALFNTIDALAAYQATADGTYPVSTGPDDSFDIGGLGRLLIQPFYMEKTLDLATAVNSVSSSDKAEDVQGAIVNMIRDLSFTMLRQSNYQPALEAQLGGPVAKPVLFVGTDQRLIRHIMVTGDDRTFTPMFDEAIVKESLDARMHDKIFLTFVRPNATEPDLLSWGAHLWSTELVSTLQVTRSGESNSIETMVQPRTLHVSMMPVGAMINVVNLDQVLDSAVSYNVLNTVVASGVIPGTTPTVSFTNVATGLSVAFTDTSKDSRGITGWSWDFGDGTGASTQQNPTYAYAAAGTYAVVLTITDPTGNYSSPAESVTVS